MGIIGDLNIPEQEKEQIIILNQLYEIKEVDITIYPIFEA